HHYLAGARDEQAQRRGRLYEGDRLPVGAGVPIEDAQLQLRDKVDALGPAQLTHHLRAVEGPAKGPAVSLRPAERRVHEAVERLPDRLLHKFWDGAFPRPHHHAHTNPRVLRRRYRYVYREGPAWLQVRAHLVFEAPVHYQLLVSHRRAVDVAAGDEKQG